MWKDIPFNPHTDRGNIWSSAYILNQYLLLSNGNYEEALTRYKGYSKLGRSQAKQVLKDL